MPTNEALTSDSFPAIEFDENPQPQFAAAVRRAMTSCPAKSNKLRTTIPTAEVVRSAGTPIAETAVEWLRAEL